MANLIPMAGEGKRFSDAGYSVPKPLITVSGKPMIIKAIESMPDSDKWIFICRKEHIANYGLDKILRGKIPNCEIITVDKTTDGQLASCLLARKLLDENEELFIGACDNSMVWERKKFEALRADSGIDAAVWAFTKQMNLTIKPTAWGWVDADSSGKVKGISVKVPISSEPYNDQAVIGSFWFRRAKDFLSAADEMKEKDIRVNNEFYVDSIPNVLISHGKNVASFLVDKYIGFGTPNDLKTYEYWEGYFKKTRA
ncbi:MAG: glycosyltransferase family 2 protein [Candidatus Micrarchaeia archaeon]|jgi:NDP-sugar pyrophosphorylase family protein